jgi:hypothetical protein
MWLTSTTSSKAEPNTDQTDPQLRVRSWAEYWSLFGDLFGEIPGNHCSDAVGIGSLVRIRSSFRSPLPGFFGVVIEISMTDSRGPYLVEFANGLRFRYHASEFRQI